MKNTYLFLLGLIVISSCNNLSNDATIYNQKIINQHQLVILYEDSLGEVITKNMPEKLDETYNKFLEQIDKSKQIVEDIEQFDNDTILREASINFFSVYKEIAENEYSEIIKIAKISDDNYTQTDDKILKSIAKEINDRLQLELDTFITVQKEFANRYEFELVK